MHHTRRKPRYDLASLIQASSQALSLRFDVSALANLSLSLEPLLAVVLTQYGINKVLKIFGGKGDDAVLRELLSYMIAA